MCRFASLLQCDLCFKELHTFFITNPRNEMGGGGSNYIIPCVKILYLVIVRLMHF